jgi:microcystin-dependent protein
MSQAYVGEIRSFGFNFPPNGWMLCQGQLLSIADYEVLFNLIGTTFGGDGQQTFALPNLSGRIPVHMGGAQGYQIGQIGGAEQVTLTSTQLGAHSHPILAQGGNGNTPSPLGAFFAASTAGQYAPTPSGVTGVMLSSTGGNQPHDNLMPYVCINFSISLFGIFPSQT